MNDRCPVCALPFEREQGYFLGAMLLDYALGLGFIVILAAALWLFTRWSFERVTLIATIALLPFIPNLTRFGRVVWIYLDQAIDPDHS